MRRTIKTIAAVIGLWVLAVLFVIPGMPSARARAIISAVQNQARQIEGRETERDDLIHAIDGMKLDYGLNRFTSHMAFQAPTNWTVTLVPEKRRTFTDDHSWLYRVLFLDFSRTEYPDIVITGGDARHNQASEATSEPAPDAGSSSPQG